MAVHGKFGEPCPVCGTPIQRIRYADNETNYCARCQTEGRLLADRALSRLLHQDWPRSLDEMEAKIARGREMFTTRTQSAVPAPRSRWAADVPTSQEMAVLAQHGGSFDWLKDE